VSLTADAAAICVHTLEQRKVWNIGLEHLPNRDTFDVEFSPSGRILRLTTYNMAGSVIGSNRFEYNNSGKISRSLEFGHIPSSLLDLSTSYSTDIIFLLWNRTLNSATSSSAGGIASQRISKTAWSNGQTSTDAWSFTRKTARRPYSIFTALEHEGVTSPARRQAVSCAICFRSKTLCHFAHRRGQDWERQVV
jgi:hypothetical protein